VVSLAQTQINTFYVTLDTGFNLLRFLFHEIKHGIYFPLAVVYFAMIGNSLFGDNLFFRNT